MKVLLATDGSEFSRAAVDECCRMFGNSGDAEVEIFSVFELMVPPTEPFVVSAQYVQQIDDESRAKADRVAQNALAQIREKCPLLADRTKTKIVHGAAAQQIVEEAEDWGADLIICGSHSYGFWKRAWIGSVSSAIVHHAPCSVMVVRGKEAANIAGA